MGFEFFTEEEKPQNEATPTFAEVIKQAIEHGQLETRVSMPAEVVSYDHKKQMISARPYFKRKYQDDTVADAPIIYNIPVAFPRAGDAILAMPIAKGHSVLLVFADRSMEKWLSSGKAGDPEDTRAHHMSDAIAIPGCYPFSNTVALNNNRDIIMKNADLEMRLKPNGHLQVLNSANELIKVLDEYMTADIRGSHNWKVRIRAKLRTFLEK